MTATGTGFNVNVQIGEDRIAPLIVTNRHVLDDYHWLNVTFNEAAPGGSKNHEVVQKVSIPISTSIIHHPNPKIDLAAIRLADTMNRLGEVGIRLYRLSLKRDNILDERFLAECLDIEEVLVIGYPNGIWDNVNNLPIVRRGVTATPLGKHFNGNPEFLVDSAVYPGSSGSPIFVYSTSMRQSRVGSGFKLGKAHIGFAGVLKGVYQVPVVGELVELPEQPTATNKPLTKFPANLGICINSRTVAELIDYVSELGRNEIASKVA